MEYEPSKWDRILCVVAVGLAVLMCHPALSCEAKSPAVTVNYVYPVTQINHSLDSEGIRASTGLTEKYGMGVRGATGPKSFISVDGGGVVFTKSGCAYVGDVTVRFGYSAMEVHIDRNYPVGSCQYRVVHEHEMKHVRINLEAMERAVPAVRRAARMPVGLSVGDKSDDEVVAILLNDVQERVKNVVVMAQEYRDELNAAMDTKKAYDTESKLCPDW